MEIQVTKQVIHDTSVSQDHSKLKEYALRYASELGLRVHPLHDAGKPNAKEPRLAEWQLKATNDVKQIEEWWEQWPDANIGIATGGDGVDVLDLDSAEAIALLLDKALERQTTPLAKSSKGYHVYFRAGGLKNGVNVLKNGNNIFPAVKGVDLRGDRGYIVAPPSIHPDGAIYQWHDDPFKMAFAPLPDLVKNLKSRDEPVKIQFDMPSNTNVSDAQRSGYAEKAIKGIKEDMRNLIGGGRNQTLNNCVFRLGQLVAGGAIESSDAGSVLSELANIALGLPGDHPVTEREVRLTVKSAFDAGMQKPVSPEYRQDAPQTSTASTASTAPTASTASTAQPNGGERSKRQKVRDWLDGFRFDTFKKELVGSDGVVWNIDELASECAFDVKCDVSRGMIEDEIKNIIHSRGKQFDSLNAAVTLLQCEHDGHDHIGDWCMAKGFDEYETQRIRKWMRAMMLRALEAGAPHDTMLVMYGEQGSGKSKFFETLSEDLSGNMCFTIREITELENKDKQIELSKQCVILVDEIDGALKKKSNVSKLKSLLTTRHSTERAPYDKATVQRKYRAVFAGTANQKFMPSDDEACRRYWMVNVRTDVYTTRAVRRKMLAQAARETWDFWQKVRAGEEELLGNTFAGETRDELKETVKRNKHNRVQDAATLAILAAAKQCSQNMFASIADWQTYITTGNPVLAKFAMENERRSVTLTDWSEWKTFLNADNMQSKEFIPPKVSIDSVGAVLRARCKTKKQYRTIDGIKKQIRGLYASDIINELAEPESNDEF